MNNFEIQRRIDLLSEISGKVYLEVGCYDISETINVDIPCVNFEGVLFHNFGVQGNIEGMDTRMLMSNNFPVGGTGILFSKTRRSENSRYIFV